MKSLEGFLKNPWVSLIGYLAGIIGTISGIYFFFDTLESRELTFYIHPAKTAIVSADKSDKLKVYFEDKLLERSVTAINITFWNAGKTPIRKDDILEKLEFRTPKNIPILEVKLIKATRDVVGLEIDQTRLSKGVLPLSWKILEKMTEHQYK
jgi:hypothetical protein